jgi:glucose-1-phosphate adenylyltransferase
MSYRGTADAVFQNLGLVASDSEFVLVLSGDHIYQMDYRDLLGQHIEMNADLTIATVEHPLADASEFGVVQVNDALRVTGFTEKPAKPHPCPWNVSMALVSMGVYVFKKAVLLAALRQICDSGLGVDFGHDVIPRLIQSERTYAYDFREKTNNTPNYWRDIGTIDAYYAASMDLVQADTPFDPYANEHWLSKSVSPPSFPYGILITKNPGWLNGSVVVERSVLSPGVRIEPNAIVEGSVLMPGVRVGKGAQLRRAIVDEGVKIPKGFKLGSDCGNDGNHCAITKSGIFVISTMRISRNPAFLHFQSNSVRRWLYSESAGPTA